MLRATVCALAVAACAPVTQAGELDRDSPRVAATVVATAAVAPGGSEMDSESPLTAHGWRWGGPRFYGGWGWGGFFPAPASYFGFGPSFYYRPFGLYGGYFNFGYFPPFFRAYYPYFAPVGYGWWW